MPVETLRGKLLESCSVMTNPETAKDGETETATLRCSARARTGATSASRLRFQPQVFEFQKFRP